MSLQVRHARTYPAVATLGERWLSWSGREDERGAAWEVEITRPDGSEIDVLIDPDGSVID